MASDSELSHWRAIKKLTPEQAGLLIAGVDPFNVTEAKGSDIAKGKTFEIAIQDAAERAWSYGHKVVHQLDKNPVDPWTPDIWEMSDSFSDFLPTGELRQNVSDVLQDPETVPYLVPVDPWWSATVYAGELKRWMRDNAIHSSFVFADDQTIIIQERDERAMREWYMEMHSPKNNEPDKKISAAGLNTSTGHTTKLLQHLAAAADACWKNYDPAEADTAPTNEQVEAFLVARGVSKSMAEKMATILRADGLPTGPRK
ncbi:hypothetical protein THIX_90199 [Thiomonas sp. X19]|uniref:hypothetical protein n=1 Tax=Thiomonas sp. X19 TaxID=1050370 RepID=UPI000B6644BE|nr:hypothetical protein [Thiomonas sp. X19]SCC95430.1 hypothetical protein THIX_90199 [Thiomonas sp. X19]